MARSKWTTIDIRKHILGYEISPLLDNKTCKVVNCLRCFGTGMSAFRFPKKGKEEEEEEINIRKHNKIPNSKMLTYHWVPWKCKPYLRVTLMCAYLKKEQGRYTQNQHRPKINTMYHMYTFGST